MHVKPPLFTSRGYLSESAVQSETTWNKLKPKNANRRSDVKLCSAGDLGAVNIRSMSRQGVNFKNREKLQGSQGAAAAVREACVKADE